MTAYRAVVKYRMDASQDEKRKALERGISECALELYGEHDMLPSDIGDVLDTAQQDVDYEDAQQG
jgi:hypothetical protein